jgi:hypothetical protein
MHLTPHERSLGRSTLQGRRELPGCGVDEPQAYVDNNKLNILDTLIGMAYIEFQEVSKGRGFHDVWSHPLEFVR